MAEQTEHRHALTLSVFPGSRHQWSSYSPWWRCPCSISGSYSICLQRRCPRPPPWWPPPYPLPTWLQARLENSRLAHARLIIVSREVFPVWNRFKKAFQQRPQIFTGYTLWQEKNTTNMKNYMLMSRELEYLGSTVLPVCFLLQDWAVCSRVWSTRRNFPRAHDTLHTVLILGTRRKCAHGIYKKCFWRF